MAFAYITRRRKYAILASVALIAPEGFPFFPNHASLPSVGYRFSRLAEPKKQKLKNCANRLKSAKLFDFLPAQSMI